MVMQKRLKGALIALAAALGLAGSAAAGAWAVTSPLSGLGPASGSALLLVRAGGDGAGGSMLSSSTKTQNFNDIWQDYVVSSEPVVYPAGIPALSFEVPRRTNALVVVRLSTFASCTGEGTTDPYAETCNLRVLLDGKPNEVANGTWISATPGPAVPVPTMTQDFFTGVGPGPHRVIVQRGILNGFGIPIQFGLGSTRLVVEVYNQS